MTRLGRGFTVVWWASALSSLADGVLLVGAPLLAVSLTRDPMLVSIVSAAATLPWLLFSLPAGAVADRLDRRGVVAVATWGRAAVLALAAGATALGLLTVPVLVVIVLLAGVAEVFGDTAAQTLLPTVVAAERLASANGRLIAAQTVGNFFLGAPVAGLLAGSAAALLFGVPAVLFVGAALTLLALRGDFAATESSGTSVRADIVAGLRYLAGHRTLRNLALFAALLNLAYNAYFAVLVLWVVGESSAVGLTAAQYGLLATVMGAGAVAGSVLCEWLARVVGERLLLIVATAGSGMFLISPLGAPTWPWLLFVTAAGMGLTNAVLNVLTITLRQRLIPPPMLGRVNSVCRMVGMGAMPVGAASGGLVAAMAGLPAVFWCCAAVCMAATIVAASATPR